MWQTASEPMWKRLPGTQMYPITRGEARMTAVDCDGVWGLQFLGSVQEHLERCN